MNEEEINFGIAWTDLRTHRWTFIEFETNVEVQELKFFNDNLVMRSKDNEEIDEEFSSMVKFYSVPMR